MTKEGVVPKETDPGTTPKEITDLVEALNCHARALVLLAREVSQRGVRTTTENLHQLMTKLDQQHSNDRENSLYASVELSKRRLSKEKIGLMKPVVSQNWAICITMAARGCGDLF